MNPHSTGEAVDFAYDGGKDSAKMLCCGAGCGAGMGLDEGKHPSNRATGPHYHFQFPDGKNPARPHGDLPWPPPPSCDCPK